MAEVIILLADGFEEIEAITVIDLLRRAEISIDVVSINSNQFVKGSHGVEIKADCILLDIDFVDIYSMIVLPGGQPGTDNLIANVNVSSMINEFKNAGKFIAAICAAPLVLSNLNIIKDKDVTSYPSVQKEVKAKKIINENVVVSGNIITSKGVGTAISFSLRLISLLKGKAISEMIREQIVYG